MGYAKLRRAALYGVLCAAAGCASQSTLQPTYGVAPRELARGGLVRITDATGYLSYHTPTPKDFPGYKFVRRVRGEVCQNDLQLPLHLQGGHAQTVLNNAQALEFLWGDATVASGIADALRGAPPSALLYDLTLDLHHTSVFGVFFRRQCLVVSGSLATPQRADAISPKPEGQQATPPAPAAQPDSMAPAPAANRPSEVAPPLPALVPLPRSVAPEDRRSGHTDSRTPHHGRKRQRMGKAKHTSGSNRHSGKRHRSR